MLELENISIKLEAQKNRAACPLMRDFSYQLHKGEIISFMGESGAGKSSLLGYIAGFLQPPFTTSGIVRLNGRVLNDLPAHQRGVGMLFQDALLFPHLNVGENLAFALPPEMKREQRKQKISAALQDCDMAGFEQADTASLSGGQKARIALLRALLAAPQCLLLDEPFSKLDAVLRDNIRDFVFRHIHEQQLPAILVTHDITDAKAANGKIFDIKDLA
ncbi:MAG: ATP-binding cassette domain-containing protein [Alphaproteobacteria bacterium]|nr:ATP-binding cassette domain-containing protein [Alphaproteobacteria bacterium]